MLINVTAGYFKAAVSFTPNIPCKMAYKTSNTPPLKRTALMPAFLIAFCSAAKGTKNKASPPNENIPKLSYPLKSQ